MNWEWVSLVFSSCLSCHGNILPLCSFPLIQTFFPKVRDNSPPLWTLLEGSPITPPALQHFWSLTPLHYSLVIFWSFLKFMSVFWIGIQINVSLWYVTNFHIIVYEIYIYSFLFHVFSLSVLKKYWFIWTYQVLFAACGIFSCGMWTLGCSMWDLVPQPGIEPGSPALGAQSLSHWTTGEVLMSLM